MIRFENVSKRYRTNFGYKTVLDNVSFEFPVGRNIGIIGKNGSGKSTLTRLISGGELPDKGRITRAGTVSFPLGFGMGFNQHLSARDNVIILARFYNENPSEVVEFVRDFAELGSYFDMPVSTYSSGMRARLTFATGFAIDFDTYLIDEIIEVGDARFREKCARAFSARLQFSNFCVISHNEATLRRYCDMGAVLRDGNIILFEDLDAAIHFQAELDEAEIADTGTWM